MAPANDKQTKKKRELELGLANNAFGAGAGAVATKMAWNQARNINPENLAQKAPKEAPKPSAVGRLLNRAKVPKKVAIPVMGATLVGSQLANAGMDAQSAQYFGRERMKMAQEGKPVKKNYEQLMKSYEGPERGTGTGYSLVDKANRGNESEMRRQRNVGRSEVVGYGGALGTGYLGGRMVAGEMFPRMDSAHLTPAGQAAYGPDARRVAGLKETAMRTGKKKLKVVGTRRLNPKFAGGAALLAAAPAMAAGTKRMSESGRETWR